VGALTPEVLGVVIVPQQRERPLVDALKVPRGVDLCGGLLVHRGQAGEIALLEGEGEPLRAGISESPHKSGEGCPMCVCCGIFGMRLYEKGRGNVHLGSFLIEPMKGKPGHPEENMRATVTLSSSTLRASNTGNWPQSLLTMPGRVLTNGLHVRVACDPLQHRGAYVAAEEPPKSGVPDPGDWLIRAFGERPEDGSLSDQHPPSIPP